MGNPSQSATSERRRAVGVAAAVVAEVVIFAAAIAAAAVLRSPGTPPQSPQPGGMVTTTHAVAATAGGTVPGNLIFASTMTPLAEGGVIVHFLGGVTLTVAPGWTIFKSWDTGIWARNARNTASIEISAGRPHAPDVNGDMAWLINADTKALGYTNVVQSPDPAGAQTVRSKNFTQTLVVGYTADEQNNQGTSSWVGTWVDLFNISTQQGADINFRAPNLEDLQAASPDFKSMIGSML